MIRIRPIHGSEDELILDGTGTHEIGRLVRREREVYLDARWGHGPMIGFAVLDATGREVAWASQWGAATTAAANHEAELIAAAAEKEAA